MKWVLPSILILFFLPSCSIFQLEKTYTWDWRRDHPRYHKIVKAMILEEAPEILEIVPHDIANYMPDYADSSAEKRLEFWAIFLSSISWMESSHCTDTFYEENGIVDKHGENVISRGLLQFSYESARGYYPELSSPEELHQPAMSLRIGAIALRRFITEDMAISAGRRGHWRGTARYWSVMRANAKHEQIKEWLTNADFDNPRNNLIDTSKPMGN